MEEELREGLDRQVVAASLVVVPVAIACGWAGVACYGRLDARQFRILVLWLLLISGVLLLPASIMS